MHKHSTHHHEQGSNAHANEKTHEAAAEKSGHHKHGNHSGHDKHEGHSPEMFRDKFWLSFILTIPAVFWSAHIQQLLNYEAPEFTGSEWIPAVLSTVVFFMGAWSS